METLILTTFKKEELKTIIKDCIVEALNERIQPASINDDDKLMSIKEVSEFLKLSVPTIYGHVHQQLIPCNKRGNRLFFLKSEIIKWVQEGRRKTMKEIEKVADEYILKHSRRK